MGKSWAEKDGKVWISEPFFKKKIYYSYDEQEREFVNDREAIEKAHAAMCQAFDKYLDVRDKRLKKTE